MPGDTSQAIVDTAAELMARGGLDGFSFRDLADRLGIRSASVHHHFPRKTDLALAVVRRQRARTAEALAAIDASCAAAGARLEAFAALARRTAEGPGGYCPCACAAVDGASVTGELAEEIRGYWEDRIRWLGALACGEATRDPRAAGELVVSLFQGALLTARVRGDAAAVDRAVPLARVALGLDAVTGETSDDAPRERDARYRMRRDRG